MKRSPTAPGLIIKIAGNEQLPYDFADLGIPSVRGVLRTGDYAPCGSETRMAIERKSVGDAVNTIFSGRGRFTRELARASTYDFFAIVIEGTVHDLMTYEPPPLPGGRSRLDVLTDAERRARPKQLVHSLLSWQMKYGVHVIFAGNRETARRMVARLCENYWRIEHPRARGTRPPDYREAARRLAEAYKTPRKRAAEPQGNPLEAA